MSYIHIGISLFNSKKYKILLSAYIILIKSLDVMLLTQSTKIKNNNSVYDIS